MSDTPRTDEARRQHQATIWQGRAAATIETVDIEFARELERELNELVEDRDYYESSLRKAENRELNLMKDKAERDTSL